MFVSVKLDVFGGLEVVLGGICGGGCQGKSQVGAVVGTFGAVCVGLGCCGAEVLGPGDMVVKEYIICGGLVALALALKEAA